MEILIAIVVLYMAYHVVKFICMGFVGMWEEITYKPTPKRTGDCWVPSSADFERAREDGRDIYF